MNRKRSLITNRPYDDASRIGTIKVGFRDLFHHTMKIKASLIYLSTGTKRESIDYEKK